MARDYLSIGEVLVNLKPEFPDVTISKIRFLESEGLIHPERTASGYRKFYEQDVDRLRMILKLQRDEYLPLRVIRQRLEETPDGQASASAPAPREVEEDLPAPATDLQMPADELAAATGVDRSVIDDLTSYGLLRPERLNGEPFYGGDDVVIVRVVKDLLKYGVQARHLTMYRHFADREASFFQQIVLPMLRQRNPEAQRAASEAVAELSRVSRRLKQALLRANLRPYAG
ncbi:MAG TPA: MerR family transcriptional regulator [Actinomycetota bacterium]|nr:MerR family transcriptional regulator [Actinomycetota bacterium]